MARSNLKTTKARPAAGGSTSNLNPATLIFENASATTKKSSRSRRSVQAEYWQAHEYPVMLVIRTSDGQIRWMNVTNYLREHGAATKQIVFEGEPFTALNVARMRDRVLKP